MYQKSNFWKLYSKHEEQYNKLFGHHAMVCRETVNIQFRKVDIVGGGRKMGYGGYPWLDV
jgi:hypothetical protein